MRCWIVQDCVRKCQLRRSIIREGLTGNESLSNGRISFRKLFDKESKSKEPPETDRAKSSPAHRKKCQVKPSPPGHSVRRGTQMRFDPQEPALAVTIMF